jgi:hypothetical protein
MATTPDMLRGEAPGAAFRLFCLSLGQYLLLAWQLGFPFFAWKRSWRPVLLGGALAGWVGSVLVYGMPLFGPFFFIGSLAYVTQEEWSLLETVLLRFLRSGDPEASSELAGEKM